MFKTSKRRERFAAAIESLEQRMFLTAVIVNTTADSTDAPGGAVVSLRDAINIANASKTATTITFSPSVFATPKTILLRNGQLELKGAKPTTITGPAAGVTINGNQKSREFQIDMGTTATLSNMTLTGGNNDGNGGGIENDGVITLSNVSVSSNVADGAFASGGGIDNNGTATLTNCTVSKNTTDFYGSGGGINNGGTLELTDCTISGNVTGASNTGGGIQSGGPLTVIGCTVSGNTGGVNGGGGGGIQISNNATITNSTIANNSDPNVGGGIELYLPVGDVVTVKDCTITGNTAGSGGGGINNYVLPDPHGGPNYIGGECDIANTVIAGNSSPSAPDVQGAFTSPGHNLVGKTDGSTGWIASDLTGTVAHPLRADLSPLGHFGGPTQTMIPLSASPARGAGSVSLVPTGVKTDQRGLARVVNGKVDIGAVQIQKETPYGGVPATFGKIQAENFDFGGPGAGYYNPDNANHGGLYRPSEGVGIGAIPSADGGGYFVGWTLPGEYLNYTVSVSATGTYTLEFRVASQPKGGTFHLNVDGANVTGELSIPSTGDYNVYTIVSKTGVNLTAGAHQLQLVIDSSGTGTSAAGNFDWIEAVKTAPANLLTNGDFNQGATGFTSQYPNAVIPGGGYVVGSNPPRDFDSSWLPIGDHTTGTGLMLEVDASTTPNTAVWQETVNVTPGATYSFTGWAADLHTLDTNVPDLAVYVNNVKIGSTFAVPSNPGGGWSLFGATWKSGASKTATIKIVDLDTQFDGNDFALDDLTFEV